MPKYQRKFRQTSTAQKRKGFDSWDRLLDEVRNRDGHDGSREQGYIPANLFFKAMLESEYRIGDNRQQYGTQKGSAPAV